jgi:hypothetical protein
VLTLYILITTALACLIAIGVDTHIRVRRFEKHGAELRRAADMLLRLWPLLQPNSAPPPLAKEHSYRSEVVSPSRRRQQAEEEETGWV